MSKVTVFERALVDAVLCEYIDIPNSTEIQYEPSEKFKDAIKKIIAGFDKHRIVTITLIKRLILVAIIAALLTGCALAIPAVREYLIEFFLNDHGSWYGVTFNPEEAKDAPHEIEDFYAPTYLPDGYQVFDEMYSIGGIAVYCFDENDGFLYYEQSFISANANEDDWMGIDAEDTTRSSKVLFGYRVEIIHGEDSTTYVWTDNRYVFFLYFDLTISDEEKLKVMESIAPVPDEKLNQP